MSVGEERCQKPCEERINDTNGGSTNMFGELEFWQLLGQGARQACSSRHQGGELCGRGEEIAIATVSVLLGVWGVERPFTGHYRAVPETPRSDIDAFSQLGSCLQLFRQLSALSPNALWIVMGWTAENIKEPSPAPFLVTTANCAYFFRRVWLLGRIVRENAAIFRERFHISVLSFKVRRISTSSNMDTQ